MFSVKVAELVGTVLESKAMIWIGGFEFVAKCVALGRRLSLGISYLYVGNNMPSIVHKINVRPVFFLGIYTIICYCISLLWKQRIYIPSTEVYQ